MLTDGHTNIVLAPRVIKERKKKKTESYSEQLEMRKA